MHPEIVMTAQQLRNIAVFILDISETQGIGYAGIDTGRGRLWVDPWSQAIGQAKINPVDTEGAFLCDGPTFQVFHALLMFHLDLGAIGTVGNIDPLPGLIGAGFNTVCATDASIIVDRDNPIGAFLGRCCRADIGTGWIQTMIAADRNKGPVNIWERTGFKVQYLAPLHSRSRGIGMLAGSRAGLATDATVDVSNHDVPGHA